MILNDFMFLIVSQLKWNNILLLNANDDESTSLIWKLNGIGRQVTTVGVDFMGSFPWPERMDMKRPFDGFIMVANETSNLSQIIPFLQEKHVLTPLKDWIFGIEGFLCLCDILPLFDEGDSILIMGKNVSGTKNSCKTNEDKDFDDYQGNIIQDIKSWTLRSPGDGTVLFEKMNFKNLSKVDDVFDPPFRNFRGRNLRISVLGSPPISVKPNKGSKKWRGYIFRIINTLADFFNFTYTVKEAKNRLYGMAQEDGSWTGMIGEVISRNVDIGTGDLSWTLERSLVVDLTKPVFPETYTFIYRAPAFYSRTWILFQGIEPKVWIAMTSASVAAFSCYFMALSLHQQWKQRRLDPPSTCIASADESISTLYRAFLGKGVINVPHPVSCRTVLGAWFVGSLILSALYGGSLTSKLSLHKSPKPADSLNELLRRHPDAILAVRNSSQIHGFFKKSKFLYEVWLKNVKKFVIPGQLTINDTMTRVHNSSNSKMPYVWMAERSMLVKLMREYSDDPVICDLYVAKENIIPSDWSIALQRDSPFISQFNELITRMERFGLLEKWRREYWNPGTRSCHPNDGLNQTGETPITLEDTRAVFIILEIGWAVGIAILIAEKRYFARSKL